MKKKVVYVILFEIAPNGFPYFHNGRDLVIELLDSVYRL